MEGYGLSVQAILLHFTHEIRELNFRNRCVHNSQLRPRQIMFYREVDSVGVSITWNFPVCVSEYECLSRCTRAWIWSPAVQRTS